MLTEKEREKKDKLPGPQAVGESSWTIFLNSSFWRRDYWHGSVLVLFSASPRHLLSLQLSQERWPGACRMAPAEGLHSRCSALNPGPLTWEKAGPERGGVPCSRIPKGEPDQTPNPLCTGPRGAWSPGPPCKRRAPGVSWSCVGRVQGSLSVTSVWSLMPTPPETHSWIWLNTIHNFGHWLRGRKSPGRESGVAPENPSWFLISETTTENWAPPSMNPPNNIIMC